MTQTQTAQRRPKIYGPRLFVWGSFLLCPTSRSGRHGDFIHVWTVHHTDGRITRHLTRDAARQAIRTARRAALAAIATTTR